MGLRQIIMINMQSLLSGSPQLGCRDRHRNCRTCRALSPLYMVRMPYDMQVAGPENPWGLWEVVSYSPFLESKLSCKREPNPEKGISNVQLNHRLITNYWQGVEVAMMMEWRLGVRKSFHFEELVESHLGACLRAHDPGAMFCCPQTFQNSAPTLPLFFLLSPIFYFPKMGPRSVWVAVTKTRNQFY